MSLYKCGRCRGLQYPADGAALFSCCFCGQVNHPADNAGDQAEKYRLIYALKKAAAAKAMAEAFRVSVTGSAEQLSQAFGLLEQLCRMGLITEDKYHQAADRARKRRWVTEYLNRNLRLCSYSDLQKAAGEDGIVFGPYEYSIPNELVREGVLEEHVGKYCRPGAVEAIWLAQALPCRGRPVDRAGLEMLKATPFDCRGMDADFRRSMTPQCVTAPGQYLYFGRYGGQAILWRTLEVQNGRMLLVSEFCLDNVVYDSRENNVTWESSELRRWLNDEFLNGSFSPREREAILPAETLTTHTAFDEEEFPAGIVPAFTERTTDSIRLLSAAEAEAYFPDASDRNPDIITHAIANNVNTRTRGGRNFSANHIIYGKGRYRRSDWWLRSVGGRGNCAGMVSISSPGFIFFDELTDDFGRPRKAGLRPALWLDRTAAAAAVCCGTEAEEPLRVLEMPKVSGPGQYLYFGTFGGSPILWRVLACEDGTALLISEFGLMMKHFHESRDGWTADYPTWEKSDLRAWLNGEFCQTAFSGREREMLCPTTVTTPDNGYREHRGAQAEDIAGGSPAEDLVWVPGIREVTRYFASDTERTAGITPADKYHDAACWETGWKCFWWLRDPGNDSSSAACVMPNGEIYSAEADFDLMVRPMVRIRLPE